MLIKDSPPASATVPHIASVDLMRGLVMVLMALDHVRWFFSDVDFSPTDLARTELNYLRQSRRLTLVSPSKGQKAAAA